MNELKLANLEPFAIGGRRKCYVHPEDPSKCIKVLRQDENRTIRIKKKRLIHPSLRREYDNNAHECKILQSLEVRIGRDMQKHLPLCYGYVPTDIGPGLMLDLIRDSDGKISRSLRELLSTGYCPDDFKDAFDDFAKFMIDNVVLTRNILDHNLVASKLKDGSWQLCMIDGFGDPAWLPISQLSKTLGRRKMRRRARVAWARYNEFYASGGVTEEMRKNSTWDQGILRQR